MMNLRRDYHQRPGWTALVGLLIGLFTSQAAVRLPSLISDGMVLQAGKPAHLWGWADAGEEVRVTVSGHEASTKADSEGRWAVTLPPLDGPGPLTLVVRGVNVLEVHDVLVGEVWLASGQSNMAFGLPGVQNAKAEIAAARYPRLRLFCAEETFSQTPLPDIKGRWLACTPEQARDFSAVAYFFARELHQKLDLPVGVLVSAVGGTPIQTWMSADALKQDPFSRDLVEKWRALGAQEFQKIAADYRQYQRERSLYPAAAAEAKTKHLPPPKAPTPPQRRCHDCPSALWNGMIAPLVPYPVRGGIWYQGENNTGAPERYDTLFPAMIRQWRSDRKDPALPFYYVQLTNYLPPGSHGAYARLRESQRRALELSHTGMAVTIDIGEAANIHARNKQEVGRRLAFWALDQTYHRQSSDCSGPLYQALRIQGAFALVEFQHAASGLVVKGGGPLKGFEIAGPDARFYPAEAEISGAQVKVRSDRVPQPVMVRYAWADDPQESNLFNGAGLPASPFTTQK